ncbi:MAG: DUF4215 domain-containing protein, partial [Sandaracinaceae bacterium]
MTPLGSTPREGIVALSLWMFAALAIAGCANGTDGDAGIPPGCGDGIVEEGEECDDGNAVDTDSCRNTCQTARCGDGATLEG